MKKFELTDVTTKIYEACTKLETGSGMIFKYAKTSAESERDYDKAFALKILELMDRKIPATLIKEVAKGELSDTKFKMDLAAMTYDSCKRSLSAQESQLSALQSILKYQTEV
jgi:predicted nucleic acid-binding protein